MTRGPLHKVEPSRCTSVNMKRLLFMLRLGVWPQLKDCYHSKPDSGIRCVIRMQDTQGLYFEYFVRQDNAWKSIERFRP